MALAAVIALYGGKILIEQKQRTLFSTPVIADILRLIAYIGFKLTGWTTVGAPPKLDKYVLIAVPHTSNWDFAVMLSAVLKFNFDLHWMGKHTLFPFPFGWLMRWLGGVPIDRRSRHNTVDQLAEAFARSEEMVLLITPEGTRSKVDQWKAGFYHIARGVGVPIQLAYLDAPARIVGFGPLIHPTGDYQADLEEMLKFYAGKQGFRPECGYP